MPDDIDYDLLNTWGREFAASIAEFGLDVSGQDAFDVWKTALGEPPSRARLRTLTEVDIVKLRDAARNCLEDRRIDTVHLAVAIKETLWHWGGLT